MERLRGPAHLYEGAEATRRELPQVAVLEPDDLAVGVEHGRVVQVMAEAVAAGPCYQSAAEAEESASESTRRTQAEELFEADLLGDGLTEATWNEVLGLIGGAEAAHLLDALRDENAERFEMAAQAGVGQYVEHYGVAAVRAQAAREAILADRPLAIRPAPVRPGVVRRAVGVARAGLGRRTSSGQRRTRSASSGGGSSGDDGSGSEPPGDEPPSAEPHGRGDERDRGTLERRPEGGER